MEEELYIEVALEDLTLIPEGDVRLTLPSLPVFDVREIYDFARSLRVHLSKFNAVGLAAVQVGRPIQVFVAEGLIYINPELHSAYSPVTCEEGCVSFPEKKAKVRRYDRIIVSYLDLDGIRQTEKLRGFSAQVFQHEFLHLQGKTMFDNVDILRYKTPPCQNQNQNPKPSSYTITHVFKENTGP